MPVLAPAQSFEPFFVRDEQPRILQPTLCEKPAYPRNSLRNEETGVVTYNLKIDSTGRVLDVKVARSSGFRDLDEAGLVSLPKCLFWPMAVKGVPVQSFRTMQYAWTLD